MPKKELRTRGSPLSDSDRNRLFALVDRVGQPEALARIGCSRSALHAALAARPIYGVTCAAIRAALAAEERAAGTPMVS